MKKILIFMIFFAVAAVFVFAAEQQKGNTEINSFSKSKKFLDKVIYGDEKVRKTFYCGCSYDKKQKSSLKTAAISMQRTIRAANVSSGST